MPSEETNVISGFYNSLYKNGEFDKLYESGQMSKLFDGLIVDGVYLSSREDVRDYNQQFMISPESGLTINVAPGKAWFKGTYTILPENMNLTLADASETTDRIDAVVIEVNTSREVRANSIKIITGTGVVPPLHPSRPTLTHDSGIDQYPIAYVNVFHGTTEIKPYNIEYVVGTETPYYAWLGERLSVAQLYSKWESALGIVTMSFVTWFDSMQRMLGHGDQDYEKILEEIATINADSYILGILPKVDEQSATFSGDGSTVSFEIIPNSGETIMSIADILVDGKMVHEYTIEQNTVTLKEPPSVGSNNVVVHYVVDAETYTLYF